MILFLRKLIFGDGVDKGVSPRIRAIALPYLRNMDWTNVLGLIAGSLTTFAFLPQLMKVLRTKSTKDISLYTLVIFCTGIFFWLIYGISLKAFPIILTNFVTLILNLMIVRLKIKYE